MLKREREEQEQNNQNVTMVPVEGGGYIACKNETKRSTRYIDIEIESPDSKHASSTTPQKKKKKKQYDPFAFDFDSPDYMDNDSATTTTSSSSSSSSKPLGNKKANNNNCTDFTVDDKLLYQELLSHETTRNKFKEMNQGLDENTYMQMTRALMPANLDSNQDFLFQGYTISHVMEPSHPRWANKYPNVTHKPVMRCYGSNQEGNSVVLLLHNYFPHFYVQEVEDMTDEHRMEFCRALDREITQYKANNYNNEKGNNNLRVQPSSNTYKKKSSYGNDDDGEDGEEFDDLDFADLEIESVHDDDDDDNNDKNIQPMSDITEEKEEKKDSNTNILRPLENQNPNVIDCSSHERTSIWHYQFGKSQKFMKLTLRDPKYLTQARVILKKGMQVGKFGRFQADIVFGNNLPFHVSILAEMHSKMAVWWKIPGSSYEIVTNSIQKKSYCQIEIHAEWTDIQVLSVDDPNWAHVAPFVIRDWDIECISRDGFPNPEKHPICMISNVLSRITESEPFADVIFTTRKSHARPGCIVVYEPDEKLMLEKYFAWCIKIDADGEKIYNASFDYPYVHQRGKLLGARGWYNWGKWKNSETSIKIDNVAKAGTKQAGKRDKYKVEIEGRFVLDLLEIIRREHKLRSYTLNSVCAEFLDQVKDDVGHEEIPDLADGNLDDVTRLIDYCRKDSRLLFLLDKKLIITLNVICFIRVDGTLIQWRYERGTNIKSFVMTWFKCVENGELAPCIVHDGNVAIGDDKFEGATVIEPMKGWYTVPVATLDFASLYPSIMQAHNLCPSTYVPPDKVHLLEPGTYDIAPVNGNPHVFVNASKKKGILPEILTELLTARSKAKALMKKASDPFTKAVLNGRQLALKISANAVYGFTGAGVSQLPFRQIAESVTGWGREMIGLTAKTAEKEFTVANGWPFEVEVIYGDTDSVMIKCKIDMNNPRAVAMALDFGPKAAAFISKLFPFPIKLEFEKVYYPYLLMNKKRYAGLKWTRADAPDLPVDAKGIESVRRDNCLLVNKLMSNCMDSIFINRDVNMAVSLVKNVIRNLALGKTERHLLVISKSMGRSFDDPAFNFAQIHNDLALRKRDRDPNNPHKSGDRVNYIVRKSNKNVKLYKRGEDPLYLVENDIPIDDEYYKKNQLEGPLTRLFSHILKPDQILEMFDGPHSRVKITQTEGASNFSSSSSSSTSGQTPPKKAPQGIFAFGKSVSPCVYCKKPLKSGQRGLCDSCIPHKNVIMKDSQVVKELEAMKIVKKQVYDRCYDCKGIKEKQGIIQCSNDACDNWLRRPYVTIELKKLEAKVQSMSW